MKLPEMPYTPSLSKSYQTTFGGYNHTAGAGDGEIYDLMNLTSDYYPALSSRGKRYNAGSVEADNGIIYVDDEQYRAYGMGFYHNDTLVGTVEDSKKQFAVINNKIIIWPDKKYFNTDTLKALGTYETLTALESAITLPDTNDIYLVGAGHPYTLYYWDGEEWIKNKSTFGSLEVSTGTEADVTFLANGEIYGVDADANTIYCPNMEWADYFAVGDAVKISGCKVHTENNTTLIVREIDGNYLRFYENSFTCDSKWVYTAGFTGIKAGQDSTTYCFYPNVSNPSILASGSVYYFGELNKGISYCFTYNDNTYYFINPYDKVAYLVFNGTTLTVYHDSTSSTVSTYSTATGNETSLEVEAGDGSTRVSLTFYCEGEWYTITPDATVFSVDSSHLNFTVGDEFVTLSRIYKRRPAPNETCAITRGKGGIIVNNIATTYIYDQIVYYFETDIQRIIFSMLRFLAEDEKITWNDNVLTQDNYGVLSAKSYTLLDILCSGSGHYKSDTGTWSAGDYCFAAGEDTVYFTIASEEIPTSNEGYFQYDGATLTYYYGTSSTTISIFEVTVDEKLFLAEEQVDYIENAINMLFERSIPDIDFIIGHNNRIWGCKEDTIYASKLGDPFNFNVFDGLSTDSFTVESGTQGDFTAVFSYLDYPMFFKENSIIKVYGDYPSEFQIYNTATNGVAAGSNRSLAVAGETLYYHNKSGIMAYTGGVPSLMSVAFGDTLYSKGIAGSDGNKYYVDLTDVDSNHHLFVYDPLRQMWMKEETDGILSFINFGGELWAYDGDLFTMSARSAPSVTAYITEETSVEWSMETADMTGDSPNKKGISGFHIRCEVTGSMAVSLQCDGGAWAVKYECHDTQKKTLLIPIIPQRADHYRLKMAGTGEVKIFGLANQYYAGSEI